jgi:phosphoserine phosphatase
MRAPICVDLDGTLIDGDVLVDGFMALVLRRPFTAVSTLFSLVRGRAHFKRCVAEQAPLDPAALPYRIDLLDELRELHRRGVPIVLATAAHETCAQAIAAHLKIFQDVVASDGRRNLSGDQKAAALVSRFGERGFDYIGNGWSDMPIWRVAAGTTIVAGPARLVRKLTQERPDTRVIDGRQRTLIESFLATRGASQ